MLGVLEVVGIAILAGYFSGKLFNRFKVPAVAGYVLIGIILGQSGLNIFRDEMLTAVGLVSDIALAIIAFIIGSELKFSQLKKFGKQVFFIVVLESLAAFALVTFVVQYFFHYWPLALLLGAISAATAPAATVMVIREMRASGLFTRTLLVVVAIDDAIALMIYGFASAIARSMLNHSAVFSIKNLFLNSFVEIGGAVLLGILFGTFTVLTLRKLNRLENIYVVTAGVLFIITGIADQFGVSALLANMSFGIYVANFSPIAGRKAFEFLDSVAPPIFIAFFVTAGAHLRIKLLLSVLPLAMVYLLARIIGKVLGGYTGALISGAEPKVRKYIGFGLISQVGVAIGLALVVTREFYPLAAEGKYLANVVINVLLGTTIITEIIGPIMTRTALIRTGEAMVKDKKVD